MLDYSIDSPEERIKYVETWLTTLGDTIKDAQLELAANYILHAEDTKLANHAKQNKADNNKHFELEENAAEVEEIKPRKGSNAYLRPNAPVPWEHPNLIDLKKDIEKLQELENQAFDSYTKYRIRRWILELRLDAKARVPDHTINVGATFTTTQPIDLEMAGLDWTNPFHVKHLVRFYSELKQSDNSKFEMEYFDSLVENTPMEPWQKHILIRYIDGSNSITVAREIAEDFGKILYPGFTSKVMRQIYRKIADEAEKEDVEKSMRHDRRCPKCGQNYPDHEIWWRKGQRNCKICLAK